MTRTPVISFMTTTGVNVGDEFIREGICSFLDEIFDDWSPYYINKHDLTSLYSKVYDEPASIGDKMANADIVIQAGAPVYWKIGESASYNVDWAEELWFKRIFKLGPTKPILNIAAGACQPYPDFARTFHCDQKSVEFAREAARACRWTSVRDPLASQLLYSLNIEHSVLPCAAFHAARRLPSIGARESLVGINLMELGGHYKYKQDVDPDRWQHVVDQILPAIRRSHKLVFIAHDLKEKEYLTRFALSDEEVFFSSDYREYMRMYGQCSFVIANRVHGAVCAAGFGRPSIIVGNDTRLQIADFIGLPSRYVGTVTAEEILGFFDDAVANRHREEERLLTLREESAERYVSELRGALEVTADGKLPPVRDYRQASKCVTDPRYTKLASVDELQTAQFTDFMQTLNCFAARYGLRQPLLHTEAWKYPRLWFSALSSEEWRSARVLALGSEISPMPWFLASLGAKVTLIECGPQWIATWERLQKETRLDVDWQIVQDEKLPYPDCCFDVVTSFSVIERQTDKRLAINEIARVLKPGGLFALSFNICEPELGMTFPEWNGRALTMREFEEVLWNCPDFSSAEKPVWNTGDLNKFVKWHLQSAEHHNYSVGAAAFRKRLVSFEDVKRIFIPRLDTFGDIMLLEGFVEALLAALPNAEVTLLVRNCYDQLKSMFPDRLNWMTVGIYPYGRPTEEDRTEIARLLQLIRNADYDLVLSTNFTRTWLDYLVIGALPGARKIALGENSTPERWVSEYAQHWGINVDSCFDAVVDVPGSLQEVGKYQHFWKELFPRKGELPSPTLRISDEDAAVASNVLENLNLRGKGYFVCAPAATVTLPHKKWPADRFAEVISWLSSTHGLQPLLIGHEGESEVIKRVAAMVSVSGTQAAVWLGRSGELAVLAALIQQSSLYVGNDSGPMHIAALLGLPTIGIFGGGFWPRFVPVGDTSYALAGDLPCFGCDWDCPFIDAPCVRLVSVDDVKNAVTSLLNNNRIVSKHISASHGVSEETKDYIRKAYETFQAKRNQINELYDIVSQCSHAIKTNDYTGDSSNEEIAVMTDRINALENSYIWKLTYPLRKGLDWLRKCA